VNENVFRAFSQYWTETTYPDESNYDITTRQIPEYEFRTIYRDVLANLKEAKKLIVQEPTVESTDAEKKNKTAVTEIISVFAFQREVDIFGNVPYSQALDPENISPAYDDAKSIYEDLFVRLDAAIADIDLGSNGFAEGDLIYNGDMSKWLIFANSLKLKLAIGVADVADFHSDTIAAAAVTGGVMTSSADNATFPYLSTSPNTNPVYTNLVASGRHDWVAANTIVDIMDSVLQDPRVPLYFDDNLGTGIYKGGPYGKPNSYSAYTHITSTIQEPDYRGLLMSYSEVQFYLAEAAARGWSVGGTAESFYNAGITASIVDDWGGTVTDAAVYLAQPTVAYATAGGASATFREKIGVQSWIASYDRGLLGWTTWRRLDAPDFNLPVQTGNAVPLRFTYPVTEQTLNGGNYSSAAAAIGGDAQATSLFWDIQ
jgi:hypothetical protein